MGVKTIHKDGMGAGSSCLHPQLSESLKINHWGGPRGAGGERWEAAKKELNPLLIVLLPPKEEQVLGWEAGCLGPWGLGGGGQPVAGEGVLDASVLKEK